MNVTLKLSDELGKAAQHRAVDESISLSRWVAQLVEKELSFPDSQLPAKRKSLIEILAVKSLPESFYEKELPLEDRRAGTNRAFSFEDE